MNIDTMSYLQLLSLRDEIAKHIKAAEARARVEARNKVLAVARQHGLTMRDLMSARRVPSARKPQKAKHRNPADPSQTWNGRGRPPKWFKKSA